MFTPLPFSPNNKTRKSRNGSAATLYALLRPTYPRRTKPGESFDLIERELRNKAREESKSKTKKGGKRWGMKYKKSINCKKPKGFSQKQYCKYGRKSAKRRKSSNKK